MKTNRIPHQLLIITFLVLSVCWLSSQLAGGFGRFGSADAVAASSRWEAKTENGNTTQFDDPYAEFRGVRYSNAGLLNESAEIRLGTQLHREAAKRFRFTNVGLARVDRLGQRVAAASLRPKLTYKFHVMQSRELNGFSLPGGHVYVTTALLKVANDEELASVLAHEVGHVVARHSLRKLKKSQEYDGIAQALGSITGIAGTTARDFGTSLGRMVGEGFLTVHSRDEEREADYLGVHTMTQAGFTPRAMVTMFQKLQRLNGEESDLLGSFFSDHPDMKERIENTQYEINLMRRVH
jgi:beta-barrel assembly-enhancing protease